MIFDLYCPLVDARGNEIYFSQFDKKNNIITDTCLVSVEQIKSIINKKQKYIFFGDAARKIRNIVSHKKNKFLKEIYPQLLIWGQSLTKIQKTKILKF